MRAVEPFDFTDEQVAQIGEALEVSGERLDACLAFIGMGVERYIDLAEARQSIGSPRALEQLQRRFATVRTTAVEMAGLLETFSAHLAPMLVTRMTLDDLAAGAKREQFNDFDDANFILREIARTLRAISTYSDKIDDLKFRETLRLPPAKDGGKSSERLSLWPFLFHAWVYAGHDAAKTAGGPLHRFIDTIHAILGIASASASTLREAVEAYNSSDASQFLRRLRNAGRSQRLRSGRNTEADNA